MIDVYKEALIMNTRDRILNESYTLFCKHGDHFSLSQLANKIGIKKQSIYNYYTKKDDLIKDLIKIEIKKYYSEINDTVNKTTILPIKDQLKAFGSASIFSSTCNKRIFFRKWLSLALLKEDMEDIKELSTSYKADYENRFLELIKKGIENGELKNISATFIARYYITMIRGLIDGLKISIDKQSNIEFFNQFYEDFWKRICK